MSGRTHPRTDTGLSSKHTYDGFTRFQEPGQQLLPGIPDEVTLDFITPKLSWRTFHVLSSVSLIWRQAIRSRQVYNARVRSQATETVVAIAEFRTKPSQNAIGIYSVRDKSCYFLPPIPYVSSGIPDCSRCISSDGKVYVLGGCGERPSFKLRNDVYVMDLAGQGQWELCESMGSRRRINFALGVLAGKIYVFGDKDFKARTLPASEMYDPESNTWVPIKYKMPWRYHLQATAIGEELFLYCGFMPFHRNSTKFLVAYHPGKGEVKNVASFPRGLGSNKENLFMAQGQLHMITRTEIRVYDMEKKVWRHRHSFPSAQISFALEGRVLNWTTVAVDGELVTFLSWNSYVKVGVSGQYLFHSVGFGGQQDTIEWQKVELSFPIASWPSMCPVQL